VNRRGRCACSQASTACGWPGVRQKDTSSISVVETTVGDRDLEGIRRLLQPLRARGARQTPSEWPSRRHRHAAAAWAVRRPRRRRLTGPVLVCVAAQPATTMAAQVARRSVVVPGAHRIRGRMPLGRPAGHRGSALRLAGKSRPVDPYHQLPRGLLDNCCAWGDPKGRCSPRRRPPVREFRVRSGFKRSVAASP